MEVEEEVKRIVEQVKELHDSSTSFVSSSSQEELSLRKRASVVDSSIRRLHSTLASDKHLDPKLFEKANLFKPISCLFLDFSDSEIFVSSLLLQLEEDLQRARCMLADGDTSSFLPSKPQGFNNHMIQISD